MYDDFRVRDEVKDWINRAVQAHMDEQGTLNPKVEGSNPSGGTDYQYRIRQAEQNKERAVEDADYLAERVFGRYRRYRRFS